MKATMRKLMTGMALGVIVGAGALGNAGLVHANGFGDGIVAPPALVLSQDPPTPQTGYADLTVTVSGFRPLGGQVITISNIGTRDAWPFPVQEFSNGQYFETQIPGLAAGASMTFPDHLAPADCGQSVTVVVDNPKSLPELTYGNNQVRFTPSCISVGGLQSLSANALP